MSWVRTKWQDHYPEFRNLFTITDAGDGKYIITPVEGTIIQQGTPQNAAHFNNLEEGVQESMILGQLLFTELLLKIGHSDKTLDQVEEELQTQIDGLGTGKVNLADYNKDLYVAWILEDAKHSVEQAKARDIETRLIAVEAQLAAMT